ncbi:hypothetical protein [Wolbachia endosymbiont (group A) of Cheilosia soror]|uniref:hypothetical protein n=1 Tax=Wolbachia endosymbiont (group A) of Cheilosia soror TaxID=2953995 RepID=UPI0021F85574|nr:hypothetical protein [Wolbachia endosymbiont (group A) of Cheilosia soror]
MSKNNVPYYIAGTLATFTLLASGVFAAAPYIGFLAPVAALSVGLPFIIGYAVFSVVTIALSYKAISKNKTISEKVKEISEKNTQLAEEKDKVQAQEQTISEKDVQLADQAKEIEAQLAEKSTDISNLRHQLDEEKAKVQTQKQTISERDAQLAEKDAEVQTQKQTISEQKTQLAEKNKKMSLDYLDLATSENLNDLDVKISSPESQPAKEENGQGWDARAKAKVAK